MTGHWKHYIRVPSQSVAFVAAIIEENKKRIEGFYQGRIEGQYPGAFPLPTPIEIGGIECYHGDIAINLSHNNTIWPNLFTEALIHVIPNDLGVRYPRWS